MMQGQFPSFFLCFHFPFISTIPDSPSQHFTEVPEKTKKALFTAATEGKLSAMQALLEGKLHLINLLDTKDSNNTILHLACEHRHLPVVTWLLQQQSRLMVNMSNQVGKSAFFVACGKGFSDIVKVMLLSLTITQPLLDMNTGSQHHSPLMIASKIVHVGVVKELLERGGDKVDVNRELGGSALTNASDSGNMEILELLLNHPKLM